MARYEVKEVKKILEGHCLQFEQCKGANKYAAKRNGEVVFAANTLKALMDEFAKYQEELKAAEVVEVAPWDEGDLGRSVAPEYNMPYSEYLAYDQECAARAFEEPSAEVATCCNIDEGVRAYYIAANYPNEAESNYWLAWWQTYLYAKRQMIGKAAADNHKVVKQTAFAIKANQDGNWGIYLNDSYILGNYELQHEATQALENLKRIWVALGKQPHSLQTLSGVVSAIFAWIAVDSLEKLHLVHKNSEGVYSLA